MRILLVEDDKIISKNSIFYFEKNSFICDAAYSLKDAEEFIYSKSYDVILLDRRLPDGDGLELLTKCSATIGNTSIIVLSAKTELDDKLIAFKKGVVDYVTKPFALPEVVARINVLLKRSTSNIIQLGKLSFNNETFSVKWGEKNLNILGKTLDVFKYLIDHKNKVITRELLCENALNSELKDSNIVDVHIAIIRKELKKYKADKIIKTVKGRGYMLCIQ